MVGVVAGPSFAPVVELGGGECVPARIVSFHQQGTQSPKDARREMAGFSYPQTAEGGAPGSVLGFQFSKD